MRNPELTRSGEADGSSTGHWGYTWEGAAARLTPSPKTCWHGMPFRRVELLVESSRSRLLFERIAVPALLFYACHPPRALPRRRLFAGLLAVSACSGSEVGCHVARL